jgi:hypothetical protein
MTPEDPPMTPDDPAPLVEPEGPVPDDAVPPDDPERSVPALATRLPDDPERSVPAVLPEDPEGPTAPEDPLNAELPDPAGAPLFAGELQLASPKRSAAPIDPTNQARTLMILAAYKNATALPCQRSAHKH